MGPVGKMMQPDSVGIFDKNRFSADMDLADTDGAVFLRCFGRRCVFVPAGLFPSQSQNNSLETGSTCCTVSPALTPPAANARGATALYSAQCNINKRRDCILPPAAGSKQIQIGPELFTAAGKQCWQTVEQIVMTKCLLLLMFQTFITQILALCKTL